MTRAMNAYERRDWATVRALTHPEAEIEMLLLGGDSARGATGLGDALQGAVSVVHRPVATRIEDVAADAAVMVGRIQHEDAGGGVSDRQAVWLTVLRDGKMWRTRVLSSMAEVAPAYEEITGHAPVLG